MPFAVGELVLIGPAADTGHVAEVVGSDRYAVDAERLGARHEYAEAELRGVGKAYWLENSAFSLQLIAKDERNGDGHHVVECQVYGRNRSGRVEGGYHRR